MDFDSKMYDFNLPIKYFAIFNFNFNFKTIAIASNTIIFVIVPDQLIKNYYFNREISTIN